MTGITKGIIRGTLLATALLALPACGSGEAGNATAVANGTSEAAAVPDTADPALDYARLFVPVEQVTDQGVALFRQTFDDGFAAQPQNQALERQDPGLRQAAQDAGAEAMRAVFVREVPGIQQRVADAIRPLASETELREINRFMRGETAAAMQRAAAAGMAGDVRARAPEGGDALRPGDIEKAGVASVRSLTPAQTAELEAFFRTPAGQALNRMGPVATQTMMRETNALAAKAEPEIAAAVRKVVERRGAR